MRDSTISIVGDMAWATSDVRYPETSGNAEDKFDSRWTGVLRRYPNSWKIVHMHHFVGR